MKSELYRVWKISTFFSCYCVQWTFQNLLLRSGETCQLLESVSAVCQSKKVGTAARGLNHSGANSGRRVKGRGFLESIYHARNLKKQNLSVYTDKGKCTCIIWTVPLPTVNMKVSLTSNAALFLSVYVSDLSKTNLKSSMLHTVSSL